MYGGELGRARLKSAILGGLKNGAEISAAVYCKWDKVCSLRAGKTQTKQNKCNHKTTQYPFMIKKILKKIGREGNFLNLMKDSSEKLYG